MQDTVKGRSVILVAVALILGIGGLLGYRYWTNRNYEFKGSLIEPALPAYDFALERADGSVYRLGEQEGKVVLIFFGYTNCPDFCPTTLAEFNRISTELGDQAEDVEFLFITVDPERDTPEKVDEYAKAFNPAFIGLSGTPDELAPIYDAYFVYAQKSDAVTGSGYLVDHSTRTIVIDKFGDFRATFPYGLGVDAVTSDVQFLLSETTE